MTYRPIIPGTPFKEAVTSRLINSLTNQPSPSQKGRSLTFEREHPVEVFGQLRTDTTRIEPYEPVLLYEPFFTYDTNVGDPFQQLPGNICFKVDKLSDFNLGDHGWLPSWGIAQEAISFTRAGRVLLTGTSFLLKQSGTHPTTNLHYYSGIEIVNGQMTYSSFGRAEILGPLGPVTKSHCVVHLSKRTNRAVMGVTKTGGITEGGSGEFNVLFPTASGWATGTPVVTETAYNAHFTNSIGEEKTIVCVEYEGRWIVIFEAC